MTICRLHRGGTDIIGGRFGEGGVLWFQDSILVPELGRQQGCETLKQQGWNAAEQFSEYVMAPNGPARVNIHAFLIEKLGY